MKVQKTGDWALARGILSGAPMKMKGAVNIAFRQEAQLLRKEIIQGITKQAPGGESFKPLSPLTLAARKMAGFSGTKTLMVRGDLRNAIVAEVKGDEAFIGIPKKARDKSGNPVIDVARVHEFGAGPFVIPITPAMRRYLFALYAKAGKSQSVSAGSGKGVVVIKIPARPFLRPVFKAFSKDVQRRFLRRLARALGMGGL